MDVTINKIAEIAGVSRGTVDRVVHNRGRVNPETADRIRKIMKELDYQPNLLGRAFSLSRNRNKIGVLLSFKEEDFQEQVLRGIKDAAAYAEQYGYEVVVKTFGTDDAEGCLQAIKELESENISGLALKGIVYEDSIRELRKIKQEGVKVITFNNDMDDSLRDCFVGQNHIQSGKCAAFLMNQLCPVSGEVLIVGVAPLHKASSERISSFCDQLSKALQIDPIQYCYGKNENSYQLTREYLREHRQVSGIYVSGAGFSGVCRAVEELGARGKIKVIGFDTIRSNVAYLENETAQFLIDQNPYEQGYRPVFLLAESLFFNRDLQETYVDTGISIKCKYNI